MMYRNEYNWLYSASVSGHHCTDTTGPVIDWNMDEDATYSGQKEIIATVEDAVFDIGSVILSIDGETVDTEYDSSFVFTWNTADYEDGRHSIRLRAYDSVGNARSITVQVNVSNITQSIILFIMASAVLVGFAIIINLLRRPTHVGQQQPILSQPTVQTTPAFCPYCGNSGIPPLAKFCPSCGASFGEPPGIS